MASNASSNPAPVIGVKGSDVYDGTGDPRVDLSAMLVRGLSADKIAEGVNKILALKTDEALMDLCVLIFQTRNIRGGKGERSLCYEMLKTLAIPMPRLANHLLQLLPHYGYWGDIFRMAEDPLFSDGALALATKQFGKDWLALPNEDAPLSLMAKWAPREKTNGPLTKKLARLLFVDKPMINEQLRLYRQSIARMNRRLDTSEIKMCGHAWSEIQPKKVPGRALQKYRKAFLNEPAPRRMNSFRVGPARGPRFPDDPDRVECAEHFTSHFAAAVRGEVVLKAADVVLPNEVVQNALGPITSDAERDLIKSQWSAIRDKVAEGTFLKKVVALCDFSGSMGSVNERNSPKSVSLAMGLLVSEISGGHKIMTFDSQPQWHTFDPSHDIFQKLESIGNSLGQGLSTDFQKALDLVMTDLSARRVKPEDAPTDILVFTDMGWDQAYGSDGQSQYTGHTYRHNVKTAQWQTHLQMARENFRRLGEDMWGAGKGYTPPRIVVWNLSPSYNDFHAKNDEEGVVMLSGWSPALFKALSTGLPGTTPWSGLRCQLDDPLYDKVRDLVNSFTATMSHSHWGY
jgi:hypothetical protein